MVVIASVAFQRWWNNRPGPEPKDVAITVTVNGTEQEVLPYSICELGSDCVENKVTMLDVADDAKISIKVPRYVYDHEWTQLTIYDNPAANDEKLHRPGGGQEGCSPAAGGGRDPVGHDWA